LKKKHLNIVLLILCCLIYGAIFFKTFKKNSVEESVNNIASANSKQLQPLHSKNNNYKLILPERDPFLDKAYSTSYKAPIIQNINQRNLQNPPEIIDWPTIKYYGFVKNDEQRKKLVVLKVDNKMYKQREKTSINDIMIERVYGDSIVLKLGNIKRTYKRSND